MNGSAVEDAKPARLAYSVREVLALTGLARNTLYGLINGGSLPARKCGRRTLLLAEDVNRLLRDLPLASDTPRAPNGQPLQPDQRSAA